VAHVSQQPAEHTKETVNSGPVDRWYRRYVGAVDWSTVFGYDVFISYKRSDCSGFAAAVAHQLRERDYTCFLDTSDAPPGVHLDDHISKALARSRALVLVVTKSAQDSPWVTEELRLFLKERGSRPILPIDVDKQFASLAPAETSWDKLRKSNPIWLDVTASDVALGQVNVTLIDEIERSLRYIKANTLRRLTVSLIGLALLGAGSIAAVKAIQENQARIAAEKSADNERTARQYADLQTKRALDAGEQQKLARIEAETQRGVADTQRKAALKSLAQANSSELAARARVLSQDSPDLAAVLARESISAARASAVAWTEGASALRDVMTETHGARAYCLQQGEGRSIDYSEKSGLVAVATEAGAVCLFRRKGDGSLSLLDTLQSFSGEAVEDVHFSGDGEWLITQVRFGALRALPVGAIYKGKISVPQGQANYKFETFGETDLAKALSVDAGRARVAFFSQKSQRIEIWGLMPLKLSTAPLATLDPGGHVLATAFDPTGKYLAALVLESKEKQKEDDSQFWRPSSYDLEGPPKFGVKVWTLSDFAPIADFAVLEGLKGVYLGDGIAMGGLRGQLRVGPGALWIAPRCLLRTCIV
jgi:hypothetical protein